MLDARRVQGIGDEAGLLKLVAKYPYCATFQVLHAINLKEQDSIDFKSQLNRSAIAIQDRSKGYDYIIKENQLRRIEASSSESQEKSIPENSDVPISNPEEIYYSETEIQSDEGSVSDTMPGVPTPASSENPDHFKTEALEDQIMREAISHLGEIESDMRMKELANNTDEKTPVSLPQEEKRNEPLSFSAWLLQKNSPKGKTTPV